MHAFYMYRVLNLLIGNCAMRCTCISLDVCLSNNIKSIDIVDDYMHM